MRSIFTVLSCASLLVLAGCGGGGSGGVVSTPAPGPTPTPSPTPTATNFDTQEYRDSDGPAQHNAITVWQDGYTGASVGIAVVDTGIDIDSPEFAGRISDASTDVVSNRGPNDEDGHGTQVALIAAAARNNDGIMGVAFDATVIALRADEPGSCATFDPADSSSGCNFFDDDIAAGVDAAVAADAKVVNISLGGSAPTQVLIDAVQRAAAAGLVIVVSAGNEGGSTDPQIDPNNPGPFATGLMLAAPDNVIIVGSVDASDMISSFSNRAGVEADSFITARGEDVCCVYQNGQIYVETTNGTDYVYVVNGTSFSAPQVAGAAALLAQAFPNLTGAEIVQLILNGARDAGEAGIDAIYGHGVLDIAGALAPQGQTSLAGTSTAIALDAGTGVTSPAMGDAVAQAALGTVVLDGYDRAYNVNLAAKMHSAGIEPRLYRAVSGRTQGLDVRAGRTLLAFTVDPGSVRASGPVPLRLDDENAQRAGLLAARVGVTLTPGMQFALALRQGAQGLEASLSGHSRPAFLVVGEGGNELGFIARRDGAVAVRQAFGDLGLTVSAESGKAWSDSLDRDGFSRGETSRFARYAAALDWAGNGVAASLGASWLAEDRTVLGARFSEMIGSAGAHSLFLDTGLTWRPASRWSLGADYRRGFTRPGAAGLVTAGSRLQTSAWSVDLERMGVLGRGDTLGFRLSQPLRVESGGLTLNLPTGWDYASETATFGTRSLSLAPSGREMTGELRWHGSLVGGDLTASLFWRRDPGHVAALRDDQGMALRWVAQF